MHALYVMQPGSYLKKDGETLKIIRNDALVDTIPAAGLTHLALAGRATVSGAVLDYLIKKRIDTVFMTEVVNGIKSCGLDPYLGTLHEIVAGRPGLACDLVEEWRVFAERLVLTLVNKKVVDPADFIYRSKKETADGALPVEMKPAMMRSLIGSYHKQLEGQLHYPPTGLQTSLRWIIHNQCRRFAESLDGDTLYKPFSMPR